MRKKYFKELLYRNPKLGDLVLVTGSFSSNIHGFVFGIVIGLNQIFIQYEDDTGLHETIVKHLDVYMIEKLDDKELELQKKLQKLYMESYLTSLKKEKLNG